MEKRKNGKCKEYSDIGVATVISTGGNHGSECGPGKLQRRGH